MDNPPTSIPKQTKPKLTFLKWLLIVIVIIIAVFFLTKPIRISSANNYIESGDKYLLNKEYLKADLEYQKASILNKNSQGEERMALVESAMKDVTALKGFYTEKGQTDQIDLFEEASNIPQNESEAAKESKKLIEEKEYQLAILSAETAVEMDKEYRDGWLYLGISNLKCAENLELKTAIRANYLDNAKNALEKASALDQDYQPTKDFLKELGEINQ